MIPCWAKTCSINNIILKFCFKISSNLSLLLLMAVIEWPWYTDTIVQTSCTPVNYLLCLLFHGFFIKTLFGFELNFT